MTSAVPETMSAARLAAARAAKGFMPEDEGVALHRVALAAGQSALGPLLEVGSYCGKSAVWLGAGAAESGTVLFSVDHHRGSEENQAGWDHHDTELVDQDTGRMDTLPFFRRTIAAAGLERTVIGVVGESVTVATHWRTPLGLLFIDGGHGEDVVREDERAWVRWVAPGGLLAIHDVFPDPADGGRPPYELYRRLLAHGGPDGGRRAASGCCAGARSARAPISPPPPAPVARLAGRADP
jgi:predicted O-methyltransferase YrrM